MTYQEWCWQMKEAQKYGYKVVMEDTSRLKDIKSRISEFQPLSRTAKIEPSEQGKPWLRKKKYKAGDKKQNWTVREVEDYNTSHFAGTNFEAPSTLYRSQESGEALASRTEALLLVS